MKRAGFFFALLFALAVFAPRAHAAPLYSPFEVSGWVPYWRTATGTTEILTHLDDFREINPFGYSVKTDGSLKDVSGLEDTPSLWTSVTALAKADHIRVIPTVMWSDTQTIQKVLSNPTLRAAHENAIVAMVKRTGVDGVDIDYEAKLSATQPYFSLFLKELYAKLGEKWLECSIEARTPAELRRDPTPDDPKDYANDYAALNKYCDRVKLMTYDQGQVDQALNTVSPQPYSPIADPRWVSAVVKLAEQSIAKSKIMIGIPTYGYEYTVTPSPTGYTYDLQWAFNPRYATELAASLGITPTRNVAGELSFVYRPKDAPANSFNLVSWSDAQAIQSKIILAKSLGVRGVSFFKIDGGEDPGIWNILSPSLVR